MESEEGQICQICFLKPGSAKIQLKCNHVFCESCLKEYIKVLKAYRQLTPSKLQCVHQDCSQEIDDAILLKVFPGEQGFILKTIRKCYRQSKNPLVTIFNCRGMIKKNGKTLIEKAQALSREENTRQTNNLIRQFKEGKIVIEDIKGCNNIHNYNRAIPNKEKIIQCYVCSCSLCISCYDVAHQGECRAQPENALLTLKKGQKTDNIQDLINSNQIKRCLNQKCGLLIAKQEGCYWVKCRCSWEMCFPCGKLWGNCEHFSKYPYQKFVPPAEWLVKALNLY